MACQGIILAYLIVVIELDFAGRLGLVVLATAVGSVLSHSIGALIGVAVKARENVKEGMVSAISMLGAVSAGLFIPEVKHLIARHAPWVSRINPFELLTDSYYSLYFYEGLDRYFSNMLGLSIWSVACVLLTYLLIRGRTYDSL